jgi:hypothetical protein
MRCGSCEKMVSHEVELEDDSPSPDVTVASWDPETRIAEFEARAEVTVKLVCADCSDDLATTELELEGSVDHTCQEGDEEPEVLNEACTLDASDRKQATKHRLLKNGTVQTKPVPYRYQKRFYGAEGTITFRCGRCQADLEVEVSDEVQASSMEPCY